MLDTFQIKQQNKIVTLLENSGHGLKKVGGYFIGPCPMCGGRDRFTVKDADNVWHCRGCGGEKYHDVIELVERWHALPFREACERLAGATLPMLSPTAAPLPPAPPSPPYGVPPEQWRETVEAVCIGAANHLQDLYRAGVGAAVWLEKRGIDQQTAARFMLGYRVRENERERWVSGLYFEDGLTIPHIFGGEIWAVKIRLTLKVMQRHGEKMERDGKKDAKPPKYLLVKNGAKTTLFNADTLRHARYAIVTEGELDAVLLSKFAPPHTAVITAGSASTVPHDWWNRHVFHLQKLYVAMDSDEPGEKGVKLWGERVQWAKLAAPLPMGKDITDYWQKGGDLKQWIKTTLPKG